MEKTNKENFKVLLGLFISHVIMKNNFSPASVEVMKEAESCKNWDEVVQKIKPFVLGLNPELVLNEEKVNEKVKAFILDNILGEYSDSGQIIFSK